MPMAQRRINHEKNKSVRKNFMEFTVKYIENLKNDEKIYAGLLLVLGSMNQKIKALETKIKNLEENVDEPDKTMVECYENEH